MVRAKRVYNDVKALAAGYLKDPALLVETGRAVLRGLRGGGTPVAAPVRVAFTHEFEHTYGGAVTIPATAQQVFALLLDFDRYGDWLTLHTGWPDGAPGTVEAGSAYTQNVKVLGTPARVRWTVTRFDPPRAFAIEGSGPMGVTAGLWFGAAPAGGGTEVAVTGGFHSSALKGPMASLVVTTLQASVTETLGKLADLVAGKENPEAAQAARPTRRAPAGPKPAPVPYDRTGALLDPWTPVVVGVGQVTDRAAGGADPVTLAAQAARAALDQAGLDLAGAGRAPLRTRISAVPSTSWVYGDAQAALLAAELGVTAHELAQSAPLGGDGPLRLVGDAARAIVEGDVDAAVVAGAEAFASLARNPAPHWHRTPPQGPPPTRVGSDRQGNNDAEDAAGLLTPVPMYALMESALRGLAGADRREHQRELARLWSRFSAKAGANPHAWITAPLDADTIARPSPTNRMVAAPYPKLMTANLTVDQGAAVVLCSAHAAQQAGVPQDQWVFVHAAAHADEEWFVSERHSIAQVPAIGAVGRAVLGGAGITTEDLAYVDLYSCFPFAVQAAAQQLGLPLDRELTQTGGLTFAGGPLNNYSTHGLAATVEALRKEPDAYGLCTALGWYATKHAAVVLSTAPPLRAFTDTDAGIRMVRPPRRKVLAGYTGSATVEGATVTYGADGPDAVVVSALTDAGARVLARSADPALVAVGEDAVGGTAEFAGGQLRALDPAPAGLVGLVSSTPAAVEPPLLVRWDGPLCVLTLNRPAVRNAVDLELATLIEQAVDAFEADPQARVAILTGAGGDFCTGMDLKAAATGQYPVTAGRGLLGLAAKPPAKPLIAAVEGYALAGGFELALAADLVIASREARFGLPEAKRGLVAAAGGVLRVAQRLPRPVALELALTGEPATADRLHTLGLVNAVVEPGEALAKARELALAIAANAPLSVQISKQIVDEHTDWPSSEAYARQSDLAAQASLSDDAAEGVRAFADKRPPVWTGR